MKNVWLKLKALKPLFRQLNNTYYKGLTQKIEKTRMDLRNIQDQLARQNTDQLINMEKKTLQQLEKWSLMEESILKQKSRYKWIKLGDSNTKYFSVVVKDKRQQNQVVELTALHGSRLTDSKEIEEEIIQFYQGLIGTGATLLSAVNEDIMKNRTVLTHEQQLSLCAPITEAEIYDGLKDIGDDKAPGVDGYNAYFLKKACQ